MRLDSVRGLKQELFGSFPRPQRLRGLSVSAMSLDQTSQVPRTVALGISRGRRASDYRLAVRVQRHRDEDAVEIVRRRAHGEVDVRFVGQVSKSAQRGRASRVRCDAARFQRHLRPLKIGASIGHVRVTAGTLGAIVRERGKAAPLVLSNNHVLANENRARVGGSIVQPGTIDNGRVPQDVVARLLRFADLRESGRNLVDCAIAKLLDAIPFDADEICGMPPLVGDDAADLDLPVAKMGRTTGLTRGVVSAIEVDNLAVGFDIGTLRFDGQIEIESAGRRAFSLGGDSGSLIVTEAERESWAVGLLFAGSDTGGSNGLGVTYANPIQAVFKTLRIELV
jgi:hypothetical protein